MQHASSIELMHADTEADMASPSWMNIRFRQALPPLDDDDDKESRQPKIALDGVRVEANGHHQVLDVREQLSTSGKSAH